jgi:methylglutaconyl-CoA hydratase
MFQFLDVQRAGSVVRVTLNRPDVRNAFNEHVIDELDRWAHDAAADASIRVGVLAGAGKMFCAGADVTWMSKTVAYTRDENVRDAEALASMLNALNTLPFPLVGRVHGAALGGGAGLVAICDIVVAADDAVFGFTEVKLGILPAAISPFAIAKIGVSSARELFLTGARFRADRAYQIGLIHRVVPHDQLDRAVDDYVFEILTAGPRGVARAKQLIPKVAGRLPQEVEDVTVQAIAEQRVSEEGQEGLRAFLEKRKASWSER